MKKRSLALLALFSCASYQTRKSCEKENWFQYGFDVAMSGKRLSGDPRVIECRGVNAKIDEGQLDVGFKAGMEKYCLPEIVLALGKKGEFFSPDFCYPAKVPALKAQHSEGVRQFCQKSNGFSAGASGFVYNHICPEKQEKDFLPEFRKGRKKFLASRIEQANSRKSDIAQEMDRLERSKHSLELERALLSGRRTLVKEKIYDPSTGQYREQESWKEDPVAESRRWSLDSEISHKNTQMNALQKELDALNSQLSKDKTEWQALAGVDLSFNMSL